MRRRILNILTGVFIGFSCAMFFGVSKMPAKSDSLAKEDVSSSLTQSFSGIAKVVDGDSIKVDGNSVRLFELDAPEYKQTCFDASEIEYNCGQMSRNFLVKLADQKQVTCYYEQKDIYNRFLGKCFIGKISINEEIVKNGMGIIYDYKASSQKMDDLEQEAKINKRGVWQGAFQLPKEYRKSHKHAKK